MDEGALRRSLVRVPSPAPGVTARPTRFASVRWLGDKRAMVVHDLDAAVAGCEVDGLVLSGRVATFGPDSAAEARNRGYRPCRRCRVI
ncbi:MAG: hypothetical protein ACR2MO_12310 [Acidimicrobiales bacterium]